MAPAGLTGDTTRRGRYVAARGREERGRTLARVIGRGASLEGDHVCAAMERAVTQQPPDRGGINVVGPRYIRLRLASGEALHGFLALVRRICGPRVTHHDCCKKSISPGSRDKRAGAYKRIAAPLCEVLTPCLGQRPHHV